MSSRSESRLELLTQYYTDTFKGVLLSSQMLRYTTESFRQRTGTSQISLMKTRPRLLARRWSRRMLFTEEVFREY